MSRLNLVVSKWIKEQKWVPKNLRVGAMNKMKFLRAAGGVSGMVRYGTSPLAAFAGGRAAGVLFRCAASM
jgi:hypothetical protein